MVRKLRVIGVAAITGPCIASESLTSAQASFSLNMSLPNQRPGVRTRCDLGAKRQQALFFALTRPRLWRACRAGFGLAGLPRSPVSDPGTSAARAPAGGGFRRANERSMCIETNGPWISLSVNYYIAPVASPLDLLDDAHLLLDSAHGIAQCLSDALGQAEDANTQLLSKALWGMATLVELGRRSAHEAHQRLLAFRKIEEKGS